MPGIDYAQIRSQVGMAAILDFIAFTATEISGDQVRGPCPLHGSTSPQSRSFSANLKMNSFQCFKCGAAGNQLDLWAAFTKLPLHEAARQLCQLAGIDVPELRRW